MNNIHVTHIYNKGYRLVLEIEEYKTIYKAYVVDKTKAFSHVGTLRLRKTKGMTFQSAVVRFYDMCIDNKFF